MELKHEPDLPVAEGHDAVVGQRGELDVADRDLALIDAIESAEHVKQRALSDA